MTTLKIRTLVMAASLALAAIPSASAGATAPLSTPAQPSALAAAVTGAAEPGRAFVEHGERSAAPPDAFAERGVRTAPQRPAAALPAGPQLEPEDPPPPPTKEECRDTPDAETVPGDLGGWYKNRYSWCAWGEFKAEGRDVSTGRVVANFDADFTVIGFGNNGARQFDYLIYVEDIDYTGNSVNWAAATLGVSYAGCNTSMTCPVTARVAPVPAWQAVNFAAFTFTSPEVAGGGPQIVGSTMSLIMDFATPTQPEWVWGAPGGLQVATSPIRYDSAAYVGRARGAIFPNYRLVFTVDIRQPNQNESALHIRQAFDRPQLTFPSWVGKSVPGKTESLTRMYNEPEKEANRRKSEAMCRAVYGAWDSNLDNCDEFPFASTYEGSKTGPLKYGWGERYSVRLIDKDDNQHVGNLMLEVNFYRALRVLDGDTFTVAILP